MEDARAVLGSGSVAVPASGRGAGVLVLPDRAAASGATQEACQRLAHHGFVAWDPELALSGEEAPSPDERERVGEAIERMFRLEELEGARIAVLGLGRGGWLGLDAAAHSARVSVALCLDASLGPGSVEPACVEARVLLVGAEKESAVAEGRLEALVEELGGVGVRAELRVLPGVESGFLDPLRADRYDPDAERVAWDAALAVLRAEL